MGLPLSPGRKVVRVLHGFKPCLSNRTCLSRTFGSFLFEDRPIFGIDYLGLLGFGHAWEMAGYRHVNSARVRGQVTWFE